MASSQSGAFPFFRVSGIQVFVHWSWFVVAWIEISTRSRAYSSWGWNVAEYLGLFGIVLLHEFGHVLACRQTGGVANEIVLWPLGGVALGRPPPRPGAELWTIAAGPLVNVALWPLLMAATWGCTAIGLSDRVPDLERLLFMLWWINKSLLIFNILPIYPLDGGQILRSLLWYPLGRARSLQVAAVIGLVGIAAGVAFVVIRGGRDVLWPLLLAFFLGSQCIAALRHAGALLTLERLPTRTGFACPHCTHAPPAAAAWPCAACGHAFDAFLTDSVCPHCQTPLPAIACVHCGQAEPIERWARGTSRRPPAGDSPVIDV